METVTMSPNYRIVIPRQLREKHNLKPGGKFILMSIGDRIEMIPQQDMADLRGVLSGMDTDPEREKKDS